MRKNPPVRGGWIFSLTKSDADGSLSREANVQGETAVRNKDFRDRPPIEDELLALALLAAGWNDGTRRRLMTYHGEIPHIEVMIFGGGYGRDEHTESEYYPVTPEVVRFLKETRCVEGEMHWGYTDRDECALTDLGFRMIEGESRKFAEEVKAFLLREHPDIPWSPEKSFFHTLTVMRYMREFDDFFVAMEVNAGRDQVRRTRGVLKLLRAHEWRK